LDIWDHRIVPLVKPSLSVVLLLSVPRCPRLVRAGRRCHALNHVTRWMRMSPTLVACDNYFNALLIHRWAQNTSGLFNGTVHYSLCYCLFIPGLCLDCQVIILPWRAAHIGQSLGIHRFGPEPNWVQIFEYKSVTSIFPVTLIVGIGDSWTLRGLFCGGIVDIRYFVAR
jgi:hypothetical protein